MSNRRSLGHSMVLVVLLLSWMPALRAQSSQPTDDPFRRAKAELTRAVDIQLALVKETAQFATAPQERMAETSATEQRFESPFPGTNSVPAAAAQKRLLALGVDAARVFAEEGVPVELLHVAAVESGFDPQALSPKGARGLWQLMPETAARFGLRVDAQGDERLNPVRSTRAAAQYLRKLYLEFRDWPLALAAYNAGEARIAAAIAQAGERDFHRLAQLELLPGETKRYVPAVLGAK